MKKSIKSILVLVCICATVAVLLALTNYLTAPIIEENNEKKTNGALLEVLPEGGSFERLDLSTFDSLPATVTEAYRASNGGFVIKLVTSGYAPGMTLLCGIDENGVITGAKYLSGSETNGAEIVLSSRVPGATIDTIDAVDTATSPTAPLTANGFISAMKDALTASIKLGGGRTAEEIFLDNLDAALPAAGKEFEKHFFAEVVEGVDAIYTAKNGAGAVCIIGEQFIAVDASNAVITECSEADAAIAVAAMEAIGATELTEIDPSSVSGISSLISSIQKTATGNYIFELKAKGYSMQNEYAPAEQKKPIVIKVSITAEGVVIDTLTISQNETENVGDICAKENYYGQFDGKTEAEVSDLDTVSGATKTTKAYKNAILAAFQAVTIMEGGNQE